MIEPLRPEPIIITTWRSFKTARGQKARFAHHGRRQTYSWEEFLKIVADPEIVNNKDDVAGFSFAAFDGDRRSLEQVQMIYALAFDFDQGDTTIKQAKRLLPGVKGVTYTTFNHSSKFPKIRVVYLLSRPVGSDEYAIIWATIAEKITKSGRKLDESTKDASRLWFLPARKRDAVYEWQRLSGNALEVDPLVQGKTSPPRPFSREVAKPKKPAPEEKERCGEGSASDSFFGRAFVLAGMAPFEPLWNGVLPVICPWASEHTTGLDGDTSTVIFPAAAGSSWGRFHCLHAHCVDRMTNDLLDVLPAKALEAARVEHGRGLIRAKVRRGWAERLEAKPGFQELDRLVLRCWPREGRPIIWMVKIGSQAHEAGLDSLPPDQLLGRYVDLCLDEGRRITFGCLAAVPIQGELK